MPRALDGLRVLEIAEGISGPYCGKLMACMGANVIKVEPPNGDSSRGIGPFPNDVPNPESSGQFLYLNTGKKSVTLDTQSEPDRETLINMAIDADIIVENHAPGYMKSIGLGYSELAKLNPKLIMVSITPFGQTGPYSGYQGTDMVVHAFSGEMYLAGRPNREPLKKGGSLAEYHGGLNGYLGALSIIQSRDFTGRGQLVDVSLIESATSVIGVAVKRWVYSESIDRRRGDEGHPWPNGIWPTTDGYALAYSRPAIDWWSLFVKMTADISEFANPEYTTAVGRANNVELLDGLFQAWVSERTKEEVYHLAQAQGLPFGYLATASDLLASPQLKSRKYFVDVDHPEVGTLPYPGAPFAMSKTPFKVTRAPLLGEHNHEILTKYHSVQDDPTAVVPDESKQRLPLEGVRVLDFSHIWAGPYCAHLLGDMGAEVIKIESVSRYDPERGPAVLAPGARGRVYPNDDPGDNPYNRAGRFNAYNRNKLGLTLDLRSDDGKKYIRELISTSDVIVENFSVGVMDRLGIGYEECRKLRPDIVFIALPGFGSDGPESHYVSYGLTQEAMSGLSSVTGYPDEIPIDTGVFYGDPTGGLFGAVAVVTALRHRRLTGEGQRIDLAQREAFASILPELTFEYTMNNRIVGTEGNRHATFAPYGCYRCEGDDSWIVINVTTDDQFKAFCTAIDSPKLHQDARFVDMATRKQHEAELNAIVEAWTSAQYSREAMNVLQSAGVPAGAVHTNQQLLEDPQYQARGFFESVEHPEAGTHPCIGMPWKLSETPVHVRKPAPCLGEHSEFILGDMLGVSEDELERLANADVIGKEPLSLRG